MRLKVSTEKRIYNFQIHSSSDLLEMLNYPLQWIVPNLTS